MDNDAKTTHSNIISTAKGCDLVDGSVSPFWKSYLDASGVCEQGNKVPTPFSVRRTYGLGCLPHKDWKFANKDKAWAKTFTMRNTNGSLKMSAKTSGCF